MAQDPEPEMTGSVSPVQELPMEKAIDQDPSATVDEYMLSFLSYTYASSDSEDAGSALVDTAAQHGLIGRDTLARHDQFLQQHFQLRVQYSDEKGGTVRGVCGSEEITQVAYIPIGIGGRGGILRVQVVPGGVPCLIPAYFLDQLGAVIDVSSLLIAYVRLSVVQNMSRLPSGHVAVSLCEFGQGWFVPAQYDFLKSEIWRVKGPFLKPSPELSVSLVDGTRQEIEMPPSVATLCAALVLCAVHTSSLSLGKYHGSASASTSSTFGASAGVLGTQGAGDPEARTSLAGRGGSPGEPPTSSTISTSRRSWRSEETYGRTSWEEQVPNSDAPKQPDLCPCGDQGCNSEWAWTKCLRCEAVEQVPKMDLGKLSEWNTIMVYQPPNYKTPTEKRQTKAAEKEAKLLKVPATLVLSTAMSSSMLPLQSGTRRGDLRPRPPSSLGEMEVELEPAQVMRMGIHTPDSNEPNLSDLEADYRDVWIQEGRMMEMPGPVQMCPNCHGMVHLMKMSTGRLVWGCLGGDPSYELRWNQVNGNLPLASNVKLCMACQRTALIEVMEQGRKAFRCPTCNDLTLQVEWTQVMKEFEQRGGYNVNLANFEESQCSGPMVR